MIFLIICSLHTSERGKQRLQHIEQQFCIYTEQINLQRSQLNFQICPLSKWCLSSQINYSVIADLEAPAYKHKKRCSFFPVINEDISASSLIVGKGQGGGENEGSRSTVCSQCLTSRLGGQVSPLQLQCTLTPAHSPFGMAVLECAESSEVVLLWCKFVGLELQFPANSLPSLFTNWQPPNRSKNYVSCGNWNACYP